MKCSVIKCHLDVNPEYFSLCVRVPCDAQFTCLIEHALYKQHEGYVTNLGVPKSGRGSTVQDLVLSVCQAVPFSNAVTMFIKKRFNNVVNMMLGQIK